MGIGGMDRLESWREGVEMGHEVQVDAILKVLEGNRITLPKSFCERTGLKKGDYVGVVVEDTHILIVPVSAIKVVPRVKKSGV
jgi:AbrB family looped-hinge helix DNA binding protein